MNFNFNTKAVSKITGLSARQIDSWDRTDLIKPSVQEASGKGSTRLYSFNDLIQFRVAKAILDGGISLQKLKKALWFLKKNMPDIEIPLADIKFLTDGETVFIIPKNTNDVIDAVNQGQVVFLVALGELIEELKGEVKKLHTTKEKKVAVMGKKYRVLIHPDTESGGYWVECPDIPGCVSQGDTVEETIDMIKDAIKGCIEVLCEKQKAASNS